MTEISIVICMAAATPSPFKGRSDNCADCGAQIFVSKCTEEEVPEPIRPICMKCGESRFAEVPVELTELQRQMIGAVGGDELVALVESTPLGEVEQVVRQFTKEMP